MVQQTLSSRRKLSAHALAHANRSPLRNDASQRPLIDLEAACKSTREIPLYLDGGRDTFNQPVNGLELFADDAPVLACNKRRGTKGDDKSLQLGQQKKEVAHGVCDQGDGGVAFEGDGLAGEVGDLNFELVEELAGAWVHGGYHVIEAGEVVVAEGLAGLVAGCDEEQGAFLIKKLDDLIMELLVGPEEIEADARRLVLAVWLIDEGKMRLARKEEGVGEEAEFSREVKEGEGLDFGD